MAGKNDLYADEIASAKRLLAEKAYDEQPWSEWAGDVVGNAVNTARSILPTALGGKGEVGISDMARGAYEGVKDAVTFPGDVLTGKQALYDEAGRPLEQAVGRSFNTAATMGGASSMVPVPDNALRIFGGVRSRTADKNALTKAQIMESQGASPDEIWKQTGWGRGAEQQWRYDIPDTDAVIRPYNLKDKTSKSGDVYKSATLAELLDHPEFFEAYPEFKTMRVNETFAPDVNGYYLPRFDRGTIKPGFSDPYIALNLKNLPRDESKLSTLLHEVQHAVQQKEGFAPGSNPRNYPDQTPNPMVAVYEKAFWNDPDLKFIRSNLDTADYFDALAGSNKLYKEEFEPLHKQLLKDEESGIDTTGKYGLITDMAEKASYEKFPILKQIDDAYKALRKKGIPHKRPKEFLEPTEAYRATAGEVEARNVQERMNMSRDELKELAPWHTQESYHPYEGQIIDWNDTSWRKGYAAGGEVDDDIDDAIRIAKDVGGSTPVLMEDAKGNKYDAKGNIIPPQNPGLNPARSDATPQSVAAKAVNDPATYDALMERYAVPDRDIAEYEALKATVGQQPQDIRQMTHVGDRPRREVVVDMPLFGGEYSMGTAPYDVASGMQGAAQTAYGLKTAPFYFNPFTAPIAAGMDLAEGIATNDPLTASLAVGFGPGGKYAKAAGIGAVNYFMDPAEAQAGPERWFSKLYRSAEALPMEKMTGEQALAMLRKTAPQEEIKWTGLEGFASENPVTTKKALLDFLKRNQVQTQDVVLGGNKPTNIYQVKPSETVYNKYVGDLNKLNIKLSELDRDYAELSTLPIDDPNYISPAEYNRIRNDLQYEADDINEKMRNETITEMGGLGKPVRYGPGTIYEKYNTLGGEDYRETLVTLPSKEPLFKSGHWEGVPDIVGHIRTQMLSANPPGANRPMKLFNVDEAQSDWAKAGRDTGFKVPGARKKIADLEAQIRAANEKFSTAGAAAKKQFDDAYGPIAKAREAEEEILREALQRGEMKPREFEEASMAITEKYRPFTAPLFAERDRAFALLQQENAKTTSELYDQKSKLMDAEKGVSSAPYVTNTQQWTDLSIKKSLDQAIDSGADYFTFTPGEVQAKRYSLRNQVDELHYDPDDRVLFARKNGKSVMEKDAVEPEELEKYIGKELAQKLLSQPTKPSKWFKTPRHTITGQDLEVGGEGMIDYYNNIYKKRVEKVVKDLTGKKIQWEVLPAETSEGIVPRLGFRIDDDLREAKFPTFASGGIVNKALALTRNY